jgi:hypothetical protein
MNVTFRRLCRHGNAISVVSQHESESGLTSWLMMAMVMCSGFLSPEILIKTVHRLSQSSAMVDTGGAESIGRAGIP